MEGHDRLVVEMVEEGEEFAIEKITEIANKIYQTGIIPNKMKESEFIVIPKRVGAVGCNKHRTISNMSQITKVVLRFLGARLKSKETEHMDKMQYSFRTGKVTKDVIFLLRMVMERAIEKTEGYVYVFHRSGECIRYGETRFTGRRSQKIWS